MRKDANNKTIVLGVETSSLACGIALARDGSVLAELLLAGEEPASEKLVQFIDLLLKECEFTLEDISAFAISIGPGSFTGLRVGLATLKGLCLTTSKPLVAVPTLDALAFQFPYSSHLLCPLIDARRGEVYAATYRTKSGVAKRLSPYLALPPSQLLDKIDEDTLFVGSGAEVYRESILKGLGNMAHFSSPNPPTARPSSIALMGASELRKGETAEVDTLEPLYLRPPQAQLKGKK